jgi:hypothetical protein
MRNYYQREEANGRLDFLGNLVVVFVADYDERNGTSISTLAENYLAQEEVKRAVFHGLVYVAFRMCMGYAHSLLPAELQLSICILV